ncbi:MAG: plastocyanin/azurin family copper-binding protein [Candidatus Krumholzibacteria bacterium]|nr:plastocyanin/azurin family copper-binding protein [Candidatus Krumholzibacteria bacterium]
MKRNTVVRLSLFSALLAIAIVQLSGCSDDDSGSPMAPPPQGTTTKKIVNMRDNFFQPRDVTISRGDTIIWFNAGSARHTTTSGDGAPDGLWNSGSDVASRMAPGAMFERVFDDTTGTFKYYCIPHFAFDMKGTVTVNP